MPKPLKTLRLGKLQQGIKAALELRARLLAEGATPKEANAQAGRALWLTWSESTGDERLQPWEFRCLSCRDTGWREVQPPKERLERLYGPQHAVSQPWYVKCDPCPFIAWQREERRRLKGEPDEPMLAAGQIRERRR